MATDNGTYTNPIMASQNGTDLQGYSPVIDTSSVHEKADDPSSDQQPVELPVDSQMVADQVGTRFLDEGHPAFPKPDKPKKPWAKWIATTVIVAAVVGAALFWGIPVVREMLDTVSTDDAFVSGHITNVSPRIEDVVVEVRVDRNDRVEPGDLLVLLDREPFEVTYAKAKASVDQANAQLVQSHAQVRGQLAQARATFYQKKSAQEKLRQQVATLRARVATLKARQSSEALAKVDQGRINNLVSQGSATQSELDQRNDTLKNAGEQVQVAWAEIQETRAALGLPPNTKDPLDIPKDLIETQSTVQSAVSEVGSALAQLGISIDKADPAETEAFSRFLESKKDDSHDPKIEEIVERAPMIQVSKAAVETAKRNLDDAALQLSYTEIRSEISGYVQDREVNPGDRVQPGQTIISVRPHHVWIEANYKETQLQYIKIGMPVDIKVDAYPKRIFKGRVSGFSPGTGLVSSLLPPQNATGNYVKVTQRLPVRIELVGENPKDTPLFAGLSVVPKVRFKVGPTGPGAGERLHNPGSPSVINTGEGPAGLANPDAEAVPTGTTR